MRLSLPRPGALAGAALTPTLRVGVSPDAPRHEPDPRPPTPTVAPRHPATHTAMTDDLHYRVLKHLQAHPNATQRDLAKALGISLGSTNFCVRAVIDQGWVKVQNFRRSDNKLAYAYLLTPQGIEAKIRLTLSFLECKEAEYKSIQAEIAQLRAEILTQKDTAVSQ